MSRSIELIIHCYSAQYGCYSKMLTAQLSSLVIAEPKCPVMVTVFTTREDQATIDVCAIFSDRVEIDLCLRPESHIFRRGIGRNEAFLRTEVDICWAADCDALFMDGCLDALSASDFTGLVFPKTAMFHKTHALGDQDLDGITPGQLWKPDPSRFEQGRIKFASGGYIIVDHDTARCGFLDGTKWTQPVNPEHGFIDPKEDRIYRGQFPSSMGLDLPNLYRFRHSLTPWEDAQKRLAQTEQKT